MLIAVAILWYQLKNSQLVLDVSFRSVPIRIAIKLKMHSVFQAVKNETHLQTHTRTYRFTSGK